MSNGVKVVGLEKVLRNLNKKIEATRIGSKQGLIRGGLLIQRESQRRVPVDTSNLKNSAFTAWGEGVSSNPDFKEEGTSGHRTGPEVIAALSANHQSEVQKQQQRTRGKLAVSVGHSAYYALFVHEDMSANHVVGQAKFIQEAVAQNERRLVQVIAGTARENILR